MLKMLQYRQSSFLAFSFASCEQALRSALVAGWEKERDLATLSLKFEFHLQFPCDSPSTELADFCHWGEHLRILVYPHFFMCQSLMNTTKNLWCKKQIMILWHLMHLILASCRAPFNLVVGLLARMFCGCFDHFFKVHQKCWILGCDFCFSRQTLFWTFALHFRKIMRKNVHFSSCFLCDSFHASETKETFKLFIFCVFSGQNDPHVSLWGSRWRPCPWYH